MRTRHVALLSLLKPNLYVRVIPYLNVDTEEKGFMAVVMPKEEHNAKLNAAEQKNYEDWMEQCGEAFLKQHPEPDYTPLVDLTVEEIKEDPRLHFAETEHEAILASAMAAGAVEFHETA